MPIVDENYVYGAPDGTQYTGDTAFVLNMLDSAESAITDNLHDLRTDPVFSDEEVAEEVLLRAAVRYLLDHHADLAAYL